MHIDVSCLLRQDAVHDAGWLPQRRIHECLGGKGEGEEKMSYRTFLEILFAEEIAHRAETRIQGSVRKARFPFLRSMEEFDFTFQTRVHLKMLGNLSGPELVSEGTCRNDISWR
jgi:hypothetical protein